MVLRLRMDATKLLLAFAFVWSSAKGSAESSIDVYFGDGCFWERQYAYAEIELKSFNRSMVDVTAHAGYGGSSKTGNDGNVCYHNDGSDQSNDYGILGYTEVTNVALDFHKSTEQYEILIKNFFESFVNTSAGMQRPDPGDMGGEYRSCIGLPGGSNNKDLFPLVQKHNFGNMKLNTNATGGEDDVFNAVSVYDSLSLPFHRAEQYHQFHCNFAPPDYPEDYQTTLFNIQVQAGKINQTGCPEIERVSKCW